MKNQKSNPAIFSFFAGAGFLDLGFESNGFDVVFVNEHHRPFLNAYRHSRQVIGIAEPTHGYHDSDIKNLLSEEESKSLRKKVKSAKSEHGHVGFIGGPPCPDFSVGGKNKGRNGKNGILTEVYIDLIIQQQPDFFLFENVKGLWRTKIHREFYEEQKEKLSKGGYLVTERLINSIEYGAPQDRDRIIMIGLRKKSFPKLPTNLAEVFPWRKYIKYDKKEIFSKAWPELDKFGNSSQREIPADLPTELTVQYWFEKNDVENHPNSLHCFVPRQALERFKKIPEGDVSRKSFKRIHRWRYSPTAAYGNNEVHLHPYKVRRMSVAEVLAIQSLPKTFTLPDNMTLSDKFKSVGNGVPYLAAAGIAKTIKSFIYEHV